MPKEIPLKQWVLEEAERRGLKPASVERHLQCGKYPALKRRYINKRVVLVEVEL